MTLSTYRFERTVFYAETLGIHVDDSKLVVEQKKPLGHPLEHTSAAVSFSSESSLSGDLRENFGVDPEPAGNTARAVAYRQHSCQERAKDAVGTAEGRCHFKWLAGRDTIGPAGHVCSNGWYCDGTCLTYTGCTSGRDGGGGSSYDGGAACMYLCSSYGYPPGQCSAGWYCDGTCVTYTGCGGSDGGTSRADAGRR